MMTTKVFQRVLATFLVVAAIFLANGLNNVANAARVQIYDGSVNDILNDIRKSGNDLKKYESKYANTNFSLRGTHYWNDKNGFRYCESHFGDSDKHRLVFQVNNNGAVSSAWIVFPGDTMSGEKNNEGSEIGGGLLGLTLAIIGLSENELKNLIDNFMTWNDNRQKKSQNIYNKSLELNQEIDKALSKNDIKLAEQKLEELKSLGASEERDKSKTFSVWCVKSKRYIDLSVSTSYANENDMSGIYTILISAHI